MQNFFQLPLAIAIRGNNYEEFERLISDGEDVFANEDGFGYLHLSCHQEDLHFCERFISLGLDVNLQDEYQITPLQIALGPKAKEEIVMTLIKAGASTQIRDRKGLTILESYIRCQNINENIVRILQEAENFELDIKYPDCE